MNFLFDNLSFLDRFFWSYVAFILIILLGGYLTYKTRCLQIRMFPSILRTFGQFVRMRPTQAVGLHPLRVFFASVGGMIGIGNLVGIVTAIQIGGPGALLWVWIAAFVGSMIKYAEIILGLKYRVANQRGGYDGGPIYFLQAAFGVRWVSLIVAGLLCVYGVELYQFSVVTESISSNWGIHRFIVIAILLISVLYAGVGGVRRVGKICSTVMPLFLLTYLAMSLWLLFHELPLLPGLFCTVFKSAFAGHAAVGGFVGSSAILAIQHGVARMAYSADLGIGYDSMIQSESSTVYPEKQAGLAILGVFIDNIICTMSILIVLISGVWKVTPALDASQFVQTALSHYFPYMDLFMPLFLFILGYTTLIAYFCVGMKCARFLGPQHGEKIYITYAILAFIFFSFFDQTQALIVMSLSGALLLIINLLGILRLRKEVFAKPLQQPIFGQTVDYAQN